MFFCHTTCVKKATSNFIAMKIINKVVIIFLFAVLAELAISCCDCTETVYGKYSNCILILNNLEAQYAGYRGYDVSNYDSFSKNRYGIRLTLFRNQSMCETRRNTSFFIQSAHAFAMDCFCPPKSQYTPLDSIINISIITINDFDSAHFQLSDVSNYFNVYKNGRKSEISEFIKTIDNFSYGFEITQKIDLALLTPPTFGKEHQFKVIVELSDGRSLESLSEKVILE